MHLPLKLMRESTQYFKCTREKKRKDKQNTNAILAGSTLDHKCHGVGNTPHRRNAYRFKL